MTEIIAIPAITVICALLSEGYKAVLTEPYYKNIPIFCSLLGLVLGLTSYFFFPGLLPADNPLTAAAIGVVSGWAATGAHQTAKQRKKT